MRILKFIALSSLFFVLVACGARPSYNVIIISVDTLRADRLGCYGYGRAETPNMDRLAEEGVKFEHAVTPAPITLTAHASLLTGKYPPSHGVRHNGIFVLANEEITLAETLKDEGFKTAAFVAALPVRAMFGLAQGFDVYDENFSAARIGQRPFLDERPAEQVFNVAMDWLKKNQKEKFFAWIHLFDPHAPYSPPQQYRDIWRPRVDETQNYDIKKAFYDGEVAYVDFWIGEFTKMLKDTGLDKRTLLILTADHGEGLGDHGEPAHGIFLYESTMHVPLIFWGGPVKNNGVISGTVSLVDIAPTILEWAGIKVSKSIEGISLKKIALKKESLPAGRAIYGESLAPKYEYNWLTPFCVWMDNWKYIKLPDEELYNLSSDASEALNLGEEEKPKARELRLALADMETAFAEAEYDIKLPDPETRVRLESLGYLGHQTAFARNMPEASKDPKNLRDILPLIEQSAGNIFMGQYAEAKPVLEKILAADPTSYRARRNLALVQIILGNPKQALKETNKLNEQGFDTADIDCLTARAYFINNETELAREYYKKTLEKDPSFIPALVDLGVIHAREGNLIETKRLWSIASEKDPNNIDLLTNLGNLEIDLAHYEHARLVFERALKIGATPDVLSGLSLAYAYMNYPNEALHFAVHALELAPERPDLLFNAGLLFLRMDDLREAKNHFERFVKVAPPSPQLAEAKQIIAEIQKQSGGTK